MRPSAPQTGSNTLELHMHELLQLELSGLVLVGILDLKNKQSVIMSKICTLLALLEV